MRKRLVAGLVPALALIGLVPTTPADALDLPAPSPVIAQVLDDDSDWQIATPPGAIELVTARTPDSKTFLLPGGEYQSVFRPGLHHRDDQGALQDVYTAFHQASAGWVADELDFAIAVNSNVMSVRTEAGDGIAWDFENPISVAGNDAAVVHDGVTWQYEVDPFGTKAVATVAVKRGAQIYEFPFTKLGDDTLSVNSDGAIVGDGYTIPRAFAIGANGKTYSASAWQISNDVASFAFNDTALPLAALPYRLDPTTRFNIAASPLDADLSVNHAGHTPTDMEILTGTPNLTGIVSGPLKNLTYPGGNSQNGFLKWDTSSLPDNATISSAALELNMYQVKLDMSRNLVIDWCCPAPIPNTTDFKFNGEGGSAATWSAFATTGPRTFSLGGADFYVSRNSITGLRTALSGGPAYYNNSAWVLYYTTDYGNASALTLIYSCPGGCAGLVPPVGLPEDDTHGDSDIPTVNGLLYRPDPVAAANKVQGMTSFAPAVAYNMATLALQQPDLENNNTEYNAAGCSEGFCAPYRKSISVRGPILSQETTYTCGPSSVRNAVLWLTGANLDEVSLRTEMETSSVNGTFWPHVVKALNAHQGVTQYIGSHEDHFDRELASPADLMSRVSWDVAHENAPAVLNIQMAGLKYYGGHSGKHFNLAFGYDHSGGGIVKIADEWDPTRFGISLSNYGGRNPYGYHAETLQDTFNAVALNKRLIIW